MTRIGTAGWSIPRAVADSFPGEGPHLARYARVLPCAEINSSFYRPPLPTTWTRWAATVPAGFVFSVKAPKAITHEAALAPEPGVLEHFLAGAILVGGKLGPILFQLPPKQAFDATIAERFFKYFRTQYSGPAALEPRHATWFAPEASALLAAHQIARVAADPARVPEAAHPGGWHGLRYYRLHGSPRIYYSPYEHDYLTRLAADCLAHPNTWVIFDNTASGAAAANALTLSEITRV